MLTIINIINENYMNFLLRIMTLTKKHFSYSVYVFLFANLLINVTITVLCSACFVVIFPAHVYINMNFMEFLVSL